jgi:cellulose synthase/poly-beta-1,6-N-acetylglucosamine synthase-like glycosyltransferase
MRIIQEPRLGLSYARNRALEESAYEHIVFVDDDNWLDPLWLQTAAEIMDTHSDVAVCGGRNDPVFEQAPPFWMEAYKSNYAVGALKETAGDAPYPLWGAGLCIRKSAWLQLIANGFAMHLTGRRGSSLSSGEDSELCVALKLAGWRLWFDPNLRLQHHIPARRMNWSYLRRLWRANGEATVLLEAYFLEHAGPRDWKRVLRSTRAWHFQSSVRRLLRYWRKLPAAATFPCDGDRDVLEIETIIGRILAIIFRWAGRRAIIRRVRTQQATTRAAPAL